jgi:hypothetical protein
MVASYSQESSLEQAFAETFGGDRPCELCKMITAAEAQQESSPVKEPSEVKSLKLMLGHVERILFRSTYRIAAKPSRLDQIAAIRPSDVPTPPPRRA